MSEVKYTVGVELRQNEDGRFYFYLLADESVNIEMIRSILAGGLMLSILAEKTPESQSKAMTDVIEYMNSEFVSVNSFSDIDGSAVPNE
jgi:hypothetical protein